VNERIKLLAEQAGFIDYMIFGRVESKETVLQNFAELIVRECCHYIENEAERLYGLSKIEKDPDFRSNFELCAEKCYDNSQGLKDHFGVEE
jgi:hypothetical protein